MKKPKKAISVSRDIIFFRRVSLVSFGIAIGSFPLLIHSEDGFIEKLGFRFVRAEFPL